MPNTMATPTLTTPATMPMRPLGDTSLSVSLICLGTMTWGEQNTEVEAHQQLDMAVEAGVNFIDTAELYPVPPLPETQGLTEQYIGTWFKARNNRDKLVLATKVCGACEMPWHRGKDFTDPIRLNAKNIHVAVDNSLRRLQTDYIDLYQLHWPDRTTNCFGRLGYQHVPNEDATPLEETLAVMADLVKAGKIRYVGLSNETPWGALKCLELAKHHSLPRIQSIQNPYNLLNRSYEIGLAEISIREQCGLLAYSPLAFGTLSGKYLGDAWPKEGRLMLHQRFDRYSGKLSVEATRQYVAVAKQYGLDPAQMALAFVNQQPFVTSNIIGATTLAQLKSNIASATLTLPPEVIAAIEAIHTQFPNPAP